MITDTFVNTGIAERLSTLTTDTANRYVDSGSCVWTTQSNFSLPQTSDAVECDDAFADAQLLKLITEGEADLAAGRMIPGEDVLRGITPDGL